MILEMGFRFRPSAADDVKVHTAKLEIMASDLADVPQAALDYAIREWIRTKQFMPKASELIAMAHDHVQARAAPAAPYSQQAWCDQRNANIVRDPEVKDEKEWYVDSSGNSRMRWKSERRDMTGGICTPEEAAQIMRKYGIR